MTTGSMGRYLDVDVGTRTVTTKLFGAEDLRLYLGGRGLGIRLLYDNTRPGLDPYDPEMVLVFSVGPLTGTGAPQSNRFVVTTKSPLTGGLADSHCGGSFATKLRKAGFAALVVRGRSEKPVTLQVKQDGVEFLDASDLWGLGTMETQARLPKGSGMAVIGPAGENLVRYAAIVSQTRLAGRGGVGAVMGAKRVKAIIADGTCDVEVADRERFKALQKGEIAYYKEHPLLGTVLPRLGTANLVMTTAGRNIMPTRNFQAGQDLQAPALSGEEMREKYLEKQGGCTACPVKCGRELKVDGKPGKGPEYETIGLLGSNLGLFDLKAVVELGQLCDDLGLDSISAGGSLGFAAELTQRGRLDGGPAWGDAAAFRQLLEDTAHRRGLGNDLAEGVKRMAAKYGGADYAMHVKGMELPAYDPRGCVGQGLEYAVNNRGGCHIRGSTMFLEATGPLSVDPHSTKAKPELVVLQQNTNAAVSAMTMCYFSAYGMLPGIVLNLSPNSWAYRLATRLTLEAGPILRVVLRAKNPLQLLWYEKFLTAVLGKPVSMGDFMEVGERIVNLERLYNLREGFTARDDALPRRLLEESTFKHTGSGVPLGEMLPRYYAVRGWDAQGVPTDATIHRLGIRR
jgi:aldehyde:ferredoxin oxidoreductase